MYALPRYQCMRSGASPYILLHVGNPSLHGDMYRDSRIYQHFEACVNGRWYV
jgi:hypothetical protein